MKTVLEEWQSFRSAIIPSGASAVQVEEMRRAFYAGARAMLTLTLEAVGPDDEAECEANLQTLDNELRAFPSDLRSV
jgi:hypothetical protein